MLQADFAFENLSGKVQLGGGIAKDNCSRYKTRSKTQTVFSIILSDVLDYEIKDDEDVFYLYNPFSSNTLEQVLDNILSSLDRRARKTWIIYRYALYKRMIEDKMKPSKVSEFTLCGFDFVIARCGLRNPRQACL